MTNEKIILKEMENEIFNKFKTSRSFKINDIKKIIQEKIPHQIEYKINFINGIKKLIDDEIKEKEENAERLAVFQEGLSSEKDIKRIERKILYISSDIMDYKKFYNALDNLLSYYRFNWYKNHNMKALNNGGIYCDTSDSLTGGKTHSTNGRLLIKGISL